MVKIALIGCGRMGQMYAKVIAAHPEAEFAAICDVNEALAARTASTYGARAVFRDYKELAAAAGVEAVVIASSTNMHKELIIKMAEAGKDIFCEKPIAISPDDTAAVIAALEKNPVKFQLGFMRRFDTGYAEAKKLIENGEIGKPILFKGLSRDPVAPPYDYAKPEVSGDTLMDLCVHDFDVCMWLMGSKIDTVFSQKRVLVHEFLKEINASDTVLTQLDFENGAMGYIEGSRYSVGGYDVRAEILGEKGVIQVGYYQYKPVILFNKQGRSYECVPWFIERFENAYQKQVQVFIDCVSQKKPVPITQFDGLAAQNVVLAAERSCASGKPEKV
jgi:scyllo-inositol 2-dehydrogenase (NAD+)